MVNSGEDGKNAKKNDKTPPPPATVMNNCHVYPDWSAVQAFYGPCLAMPPYSNSPVTSSPATPPYMWGPSQSMIAHYGAPYAAFYAPFAHPGVPVAGGAAPTMESPAKSAGNSGERVLKKHKEIDSLAISIGNGSVDDSDPPTEHQSSDSEATDGSSHGSNGGLARTAKGHRKRSHQTSPTKEHAKAQKENVFPSTEAGRAFDAVPSNATGEKSGNVSTPLDFKSMKPTPVDALQPSPSETWLQNEQELKRERRKQSNRESARRSRLRKQAEAEELAGKVQALLSDNMSMKSEIKRMMEQCKKLKHENGVLMGKLNDTQLRRIDDDHRLKPGEPAITRLKTDPPLATVNLLARVNNSDGGGGGHSENDGREVYESRSAPVKLHQLLDAGH